jgi:biotin-dependent carboxylase-like uncharacterized protein
VSELVVVRAGWATSLQDGGRAGSAAIGVPPSGAIDEPGRLLLNRLVGNPPEAAVLETLGALRVRTTGPAVVATSAELAPTSVGSHDEITVEPAPGAMWGYLAVRGGIAVAPVLGSRSTDSRSGLGPPVIEDGAVLPIGADPGTPIVVDQAPGSRPAGALVGIWPGPRREWFEPESLDVLTGAMWTVSSDASRVGVRLDGPSLRRRVTGELPSEGILTGAIQVPPDGRPVVMLADHPTTGGYPVLAVVDPGAIAVIGQARPGTTVWFRLLQ